MNIIAVDDEKLALRDLTQILELVLPEASVSGFRTPQEALAHAWAVPVDIAFLDVEMKGMNGLELAKQLKDIRGRTNIVFATGFSQYAVDAFSVCASDYILKPVEPEAIRRALERLRSPVHEAGHGLRVQCFGNFEVFHQGKPVEFSRSKAKELFAYLIHKHGAGCTTRELCAVLFEDKAYSLSLSKQMQVIISSMTHSLEKVGSRNVIIKTYNSIAVDMIKLDCDFYRFLAWDPEAVNAYSGEYMANYGWAEFMSATWTARCADGISVLSADSPSFRCPFVVLSRLA